jgi:acyl-CoA thioester hydrolase
MYSRSAMPSDDSVRRGDFRFWVKIPVRWGDMDAIGHLNNTAYFTYCESARLEYLARIGLGGRFWEATEGPALAHAALNFRRSVRHPAVIDVGVRVPEVRNRSFRMDYAIFVEATDTVVADGTSVIVWADYRAERATELPAQVRQAIASVERGDD